MKKRLGVGAIAIFVVAASVVSASRASEWHELADGAF